MDTIFLRSDDPSAIPMAVELLAKGDPVALPTETVYGLAADAQNPQAAAAVFHAKERPFFDPLIVHLPESDWIERVARVPEESQTLVNRLTAAFWPGPLTLLLPRRAETIPDLITAGSALVAVRMSAHLVFQQIVGQFGRPLAAPSANRFGRISPTTGAHAMAELQGRIPLVIEAGPTSHGLESTIVAIEGPDEIRVLRHGPVTTEQLEDFATVLAGSAGEVVRSAPGQVAGHYAPRTPLRLLDSSSIEEAAWHGRRVGLLAFRRDRMPELAGIGHIETLSADGDLLEAATRLFASLRSLDEAGLDGILAETVPETGLGRAIMERLRRAAAGSG